MSKKIWLVALCVLFVFGCDSKDEPVNDCEQMKAEILCEVKGHIWRFKHIQEMDNHYMDGYRLIRRCNRCGGMDTVPIYHPRNKFIVCDPNKYYKSDYVILQKLIWRHTK